MSLGNRSSRLGGATLAIALFALLLATRADAGFQFPLSYQAGSVPMGVAIADLDGDGRPDLAVANHDSTDVSILLGNGDGSFQEAISYAAGVYPQWVAAADLNGDGSPDLAVANYGSTDVSILLGNGDGSFQTAVNYGVEAGFQNGPIVVVVADLNGDGKPDLALANRYAGYVPPTVSVLLGNGDGSFQTAVNYSAGSDPYFVAVADLNGDGKPDLAVADAYSQSVFVLLGNGDGTFQTGVPYWVGRPPLSVAAADLNGDGRLDLAVATGWDVSVLLGNGDGSFQAPVDYGAGTTPYFVVVADLDGDGIPDLAVANQQSTDVSILLGNGDGSFQTAISYWAITFPGTYPRSLAVGDVNGDDRPDLALGTGSDVSVLLQGGTAIPPPVGAGIEPSGVLDNGVPVIYWHTETTLTAPGCAGGTGSYVITLDDGYSISGPMTEDPTGSGTYVGTVPALSPHHGLGHIAITITCPDSSTEQINFDFWIDPSGVVTDTSNNAIPGATVTLYRSGTGASGSFSQVANGSSAMSPSNRVNPDLTDGLGQFGWDVVPGYYIVRAAKTGCVDPQNSSQPYVETAVLQIPPPETDLVLVLDCDSPTAVHVSSLVARRSGAAVVVNWRTASETQTLGFNLYHQQRGKLVKLNRSVIPSVFAGTASGHAYSFLDRTAQRGVTYTYRLQAVGLDGTRAWLGTAVATR